MEDLAEDRGIGPAEVARWCDFVSMHGYPIYADWAVGPTDDRLVPFLALITLAGGRRRRAVRGVRSPTIPVAGPASSDGPSTKTSPRPTRAGPPASGPRAWEPCCGAQRLHHPTLFNTAPLDSSVHERTFGLWRADGARSQPSHRCRPGPAEIARARATGVGSTSSPKSSPPIAKRNWRASTAATAPPREPTPPSDNVKSPSGEIGLELCGRTTRSTSTYQDWRHRCHQGQRGSDTGIARPDRQRLQLKYRPIERHVSAHTG